MNLILYAIQGAGQIIQNANPDFTAGVVVPLAGVLDAPDGAVVPPAGAVGSVAAGQVVGWDSAVAAAVAVVAAKFNIRKLVLIILQ